MTAGRRGLVIAIDGPSGVGKSTIARLLADRLGYRYIDTGAMYRALAWLARRNGVSLNDPRPLASLGMGMDIQYTGGAGGARIRVSGRDVTEEIRKPGVGDDASRVSQFPEVREALVRKQRELGAGGSVVMEGRDIGSVVFPDADLKVFLEADLDERARRRDLQWRGKGIEVPREKILDEIRGRDQRDSGRKVAPLRVPEGAVRIDTTRMSQEEVLEAILSRLAGRSPAGPSK
ncbi:MAG: (d)CMP kinase [bacterium]